MRSGERLQVSLVSRVIPRAGNEILATIFLTRAHAKAIT